MAVGLDDSHGVCCVRWRGCYCGGVYDVHWMGGYDGCVHYLSTFAEGFEGCKVGCFLGLHLGEFEGVDGFQFLGGAFAGVVDDVG